MHSAGDGAPPKGGPAVIERHITFTILPEKAAPFEQFIANEYGPTMAKAPGFVKIELLREADSTTRYQLVFRFQDAESAAGWRTSEVHAALQPALKALNTDMQIQGYVVVG
jgi:antibiotic biosynthesis monooxygenase (ABM) superfamily enzyme